MRVSSGIFVNYDLRYMLIRFILWAVKDTGAPPLACFGKN